MGRGILPKVRDGSGDPLKGSGRVGGPSWRSETGQEVLRTDWNGSGGTPEGPALVGTLCQWV